MKVKKEINQIWISNNILEFTSIKKLLIVIFITSGNNMFIKELKVTKKEKVNRIMETNIIIIMKMKEMVIRT